MKLAIACSEAVPFSKTGGLADVMGVLPRLLAEQEGMDTLLFVPWHRCTRDAGKTQVESAGRFFVDLAWRRAEVQLLRLSTLAVSGQSAVDRADTPTDRTGFFAGCTGAGKTDNF